MINKMKQEEEDEESENILKFCDDIFYVITIFNIRKIRDVLDNLLPKSNNELAKFTKLCLEFYRKREE